MRRASRASASSASRAAACSGATSVSGQATTTLATRSSLRTARSTRAARLATAPARISMGRSVRRRRARARPATAWARHPGAAAAWAAAAHSAALASSAQMMSARRPTPGPSPGVSGVINPHSSAACSTAGGRTSTTGRPRSSAAFASATVTRSSVVKGRLVWGMVRSGGRKGNGCVARLPVAILSPMSPASGFSPNLQHLETSATIAISQEAKRHKAAGEDVIDLGAGEPDFPTPSIPADAGVRAIRGGKTHYPANEGILELRAAAAKHLSLLSGGRPVNADNIVVSNGSKQSLFNVCFTLFGPGDVVAIPAPAWVSYPQIVHLARARPVRVSGEPDGGLAVAYDDGRERSGAARGRGGARGRTGGAGRRADGGRVPQAARSRGGAVPAGAAGGRVRRPPGGLLLLLSGGFLRRTERHGILHSARHHQRRGTRAGGRVRRRPLRAVVVRGGDGRPAASIGPHRRICEEAGGLELRRPV